MYGNCILERGYLNMKNSLVPVNDVGLVTTHNARHRFIAQGSVKKTRQSYMPLPN